ncbi:MAG: NERD domain-containing protein [Nitrospiraceae bacterium]|nr:NERD domain-containing protein [Nitrospiraceae bacterium]
MLTAILLVVILTAVLSFLKLPVVKGWFGEKITSAGMWTFLDADKYRRIDNLIVPSLNGTTQIDHVLISAYGIFVLETKNMKGWIFGSPENDKWTQSIYGKKRHFQNPMKQNYRHVRCLMDYLHIEEKIFRPVVFFIGNCKFKTPMPSNVLNGGLIPYVQSFNIACLTTQQVADIEGRLIALRKDRSLTKQVHLASLRDRHESTTTCPRCGAELVRRVAKKGNSTGDPFLGCSTFPKCRFTRPV